MIRIKTICKDSPSAFDAEVNKALAKGWELVRRDFDAQGYIAELELLCTCRNCKHERLSNNMYPCRSCQGHNRWEAKA